MPSKHFASTAKDAERRDRKMGKFKRRLGAVLYYSIAKHLPVSYSSIRIGQTALRRFAEGSCSKAAERR